MIKEFLTIEELAETLNVGVSTIYEYRADKKFINGVHFVKAGRSTLYIRETCLHWMLSRGNEAAHQRFIENWQRDHQLVLC